MPGYTRGSCLATGFDPEVPAQDDGPSDWQNATLEHGSERDFVWICRLLTNVSHQDKYPDGVLRNPA
jgi:hypothetical protein